MPKETKKKEKHQLRPNKEKRQQREKQHKEL